MALDNELWLVFTWYALRGRSSDPERLTTAQLARLCEDCRFFGPRRFSKHDMENACAVLRRRRRREEWRGLAFKEFVSLLAAFSERIYGPSRDDAFERLVTERVFPLAKRRRHPLDIAPVATNADVIRVRRWLEAEIGAVFEYYASRESTRSSTLLWDDLRRFSRDFGLKFSSTDIAEAYLSSLDGRGRLGLEGFWEIILRLALGCCSDFQAAAVERKRHSRPYADLVKSVLLDLYRAQDATVELAASERRVPSQLRSDLRAIVAKFKARFKQLWERDGFRDYREAPNPSVDNVVDQRTQGVDNLTRLLFSTIPARRKEEEEDDDDVTYTSQHVDADDDHLQDDDDDDDGDESGGPVVELLRDANDLGDPRFSVDDLEILIRKRPLIGKMLQVTIAASAETSSSEGIESGEEDD